MFVAEKIQTGMRDEEFLAWASAHADAIDPFSSPGDFLDRSTS